MKFAYCVLAIGLCAASAVAKDEKINRPKVYNDLIACRALPGADERLACFDAASKKMEEATESRDVVLLDKNEVRKTKRSLFGFSLPRLPFFGGDDEEQDEEFTQIEGAMASVQQLGNGRYQFTMKDAGTWQTTETAWAPLREGQVVKIKRGAVGSYMMVLKNGGVRVKRVN